MSVERADRLTTFVLTALTVTVATAVAVWTLSIGLELFIWAIVSALLVTLIGVITWALFHHRIAELVFHPVRRPDDVELTREHHDLPGVRAIGRWLYERPRWSAPLVGGSILVLLDTLAWIGLLDTPLAFRLMAGLTLVSLVLGVLMGDVEEEDRRADLPLTMAGVWGVLYVLKTGLLPALLMWASWPGYLVLIGLVFMRDWPRRYIWIGLPVLIVFNLVVLFTYWRR